MEEYRIIIEKTFRRVAEIEAETPGLVICKAEDEYNRGRYVSSADNSTGADIALLTDDSMVMETLEGVGSTGYVQRRFEECRESISVEDEVRLVSGSFDNTLHGFGEYRKEAIRNRLQVYLLYRNDARHNRFSMELIAPFSSFENMMGYPWRKKKESRLTGNDLGEFKNNRQTGRCDESYLYKSDYLDVLPEQEPELPPKDNTSYNKVLAYGQSEPSRRELESLPEPFGIYHIMDEEIEQIVYGTEMEIRDRLWFGKRKFIDFDNDHHSEIWWEEMKKAVVRYGVSYYEAE